MRASTVTYCLVTDGDAGGFDLTIPRPQMAEMRRVEQTRAAKEVGVESLMFLGHGDGRVVADLVLRRDLSRVIRQVRPTLVITQSPVRDLSRIYASHPDHLATAEAAIAAVYPDSRNPFAYPELIDDGLEAWTVPEVWVMGGPTPSTAIDVTDQVDRKIRALLCHETQHVDPAGDRDPRARVDAVHRRPVATGRGPLRRGVPGGRHPLTPANFVPPNRLRSGATRFEF